MTNDLTVLLRPIHESGRPAHQWGYAMAPYTDETVDALLNAHIRTAPLAQEEFWGYYFAAEDADAALAALERAGYAVTIGRSALHAPPPPRPGQPPVSMHPTKGLDWSWVTGAMQPTAAVALVEEEPEPVEEPEPEPAVVVRVQREARPRRYRDAPTRRSDSVQPQQDEPRPRRKRHRCSEEGPLCTDCAIRLDSRLRRGGWQ